MSLAATLGAAVPRSVGMGQILTGRPGEVLSAVLGSCVGVALHHPRARLGALAHVVLPESQGRDAPPGKFADTAIPAMIRDLEALGAPRAGLVARIAGGACMFGVSGPLQIGLTNVEAVVRALAAANIRLVGRDVAGEKGRRVRFHCETGQLVVEIAGAAVRTL